MARKIGRRIPEASSLTFTSNGPPMDPCGPWQWQTEEFDCDQDPKFFVRVHWTYVKGKYFVQYFHRDLMGLGASFNLPHLLKRLESFYGRENY